MNPCVAFNDDKTLNIGRLDPQIVKPHLASVTKFKKLIHDVSKATGFKPRDAAADVLPLDPQMSRLWSLQYPMDWNGPPPVAWKFGERIDLALVEEDRALFVIDKEVTAEEAQLIIESVLGPMAVVAATKHQAIKSDFDQILNNLGSGDWGNEGGTC
jgi:hypothetical protein